MTLTLEILWTMLCPRYWCQHGQFMSLDYPWVVDVHGHGILVMWPFDLGTKDLSLGILVDPIVSKVLMPTWPVCACQLFMSSRCAWAWNFVSLTWHHDLDLGILVNFGLVTFQLWPWTMTLTLGFLWYYIDVSTADPRWLRQFSSALPCILPSPHSLKTIEGFFPFWKWGRGG